ncbi:Uncharacterised protein [uncultured archaeon]|nr:Uncharacterised protein [uncultured archaeon]
MCEMIDEIEIEHLRTALARAKKELREESITEEPIAAVAQ